MPATLTLIFPPKRRNVPEHARGAAAPVQNLVQYSDGPRDLRDVAHLERELPPGGVPAYLAARGEGARSFILWADEHRSARVATVVTESARKGVSTFHVLGTHGEFIGTLVREKALRGKGLRTRWTVKQPGLPDAVGYKGRVFWWMLWWLFSPLMPFVLLVALFDAGDVPRPPRRIRWRAAGRLVVDHRPSGERLELCAPEVDWRLGAALMASVHSFNGWLGRPWDVRDS